MLEGLDEFGPREKSFYAKTLGEAAVLSATTTTARIGPLVVGARYIVYVSSTALGANTLWLRQGNDAIDATTAVPSIPIVADTRTEFEFQAEEGLDHIAGIMSAGTVSAYVVRISQPC